MEAISVSGNHCSQWKSSYLVEVTPFNEINRFHQKEWLPLNTATSTQTNGFYLMKWLPLIGKASRKTSIFFSGSHLIDSYQWKLFLLAEDFPLSESYSFWSKMFLLVEGFDFSGHCFFNEDHSFQWMSFLLVGPLLISGIYSLCSRNHPFQRKDSFQ